MKTLARAMVMVVVGTLIAGGALAQFAKPEDAIKYRKSVMVLIAQHFKSMGAVVQGKVGIMLSKYFCSRCRGRQNTWRRFPGRHFLSPERTRVTPP